MPDAFGEIYPFITPTDISDGQRRAAPTRFLSDQGRVGQEALLLPPRTVCTVCIGATIGKICLSDAPSFTNQQINSVIVDRSRHDPDFVYYLLSTLGGELRSRAGGAATPIINKTAFSGIEVSVPERTVQQAVGSVLSAYDDLIENNTKRIKILEEMARSLYREWFVNFRFPGHKKTKFVKSPLGMIPADWRVDRLDSALVLQRGFDLPVGARVPGTVPIYAATGVVGTHEIAKAKGPGVVTGRSGSLGTVLFVREDYWPLNTALWVKEFRSVGPVFAYFLLSNLDLKGMDGGAAVPTLNRNHAHALNVAIPPVGLVHHFEALADDFLRQTEILAKASEILRATRDLLLPRLISGEIDVSSLPLEPAAS